MSRVTMDITPKELFVASLERCSASDEFIPTFYRRFMASSADIRVRFRFTSFERQNILLLKSLQLAATAIEGDPQALADLKARSQTHDRHHLNIKPAEYDLWLEALVTTAAEFDEDWGPSTEEGWRTVLGFVIRRMTASY